MTLLIGRASGLMAYFVCAALAARQTMHYHSVQRMGQARLQAQVAPEKKNKDSASAPAPASAPGTATSSNTGGTVTSISLESEKQLSAIQEESNTTAQAAQGMRSEIVVGQLNVLSDEFSRLREDDTHHVEKLLFHLQLRERLRDRLEKESEVLKSDDGLLTTQVMSVKGPSNASIGTGSGLSLLGLNQTFGFLAKTDSKRTNASATQLDEDLARSALSSLAELEEEVTQVRAKDKEEVAALEANARNREMLKDVIKRQQEQLAADANTLDGSLEQIQHIANADPILRGAPQSSPDGDRPPARSAATNSPAQDLRSPASAPIGVAESVSAAEEDPGDLESA